MFSYQFALTFLAPLWLVCVAGENVRELQQNCGGRGPCTRGASCVNNFCVCGDGWVSDPNLRNVALAGYLSCVDKDECASPSSNICAAKESGGLCVDFDPPIKYKCFCDIKKGFVASKTDPTFGEIECKKVNFFQRVSTFTTCSQLNARCDTSSTTLAEIVSASEDGETLIYTDGEQKALGFVDISDISKPVASGLLPLKGEPTSVTTKGGFALVVVNTSKDKVDTSGELNVIEIKQQRIIATFDLGGQPDAISVSPDGKFGIVAIENERNEGLNGGSPPQLPAGYVMVLDCADSDPRKWSTTKVELTNLPNVLYPTDPEPEFVSINSDNIAAVTLQENNALVLIDLAKKVVTGSFSAGSVSLTAIDDTEEDVILMAQNKSDILREPDGIVWIDTRYVATADEGDFKGGSRGFTIFDSTNGAVVYASGNLLEHLSVRFGHYPEDRSRNKGSEPENIAMGTFKGFKRLFVNTERASLVFIFDVEDVANPKFIQALPTGSGPEGGLTIPSRGLYVVASEVDDRAAKIRSSITIFEDGYTHVNYPTIISANRADNTPIPFSALSGLAAEIRGNGNDVSNIMYSVEDSYFKKSRLFYIDISSFPAVITKEYRLLDTNKRLIVAPLGTKLVNSDLTVNLDLEGIAVSRLGGFWVVSEGAGTAGDPSRPITSNNYLIKVSNEGEIQNVVTLPKEVNDIQSRFGFEGCAEGSGSFANKVVVTFQRAWGGESSPRLGVYDFILNSWTFYFYPLEKVQSQFGGWVGLSDIAPLEGGKFLVVERDDQGGPDGVIKSLYMIDLEGAVIGSTISKTFVRDLTKDILSRGGLLLEKIEGVAVTRSGKVWIVNDNDGVEGNSGEIQLLEVSETQYRPRLEGSPPGYENVMIVHINDHHSNFDEQVIDLPKSLIPPTLSTTTSSLRVFYGGFDRSVTLMNSMVSEANAKGHDVIKVHAGDALTGTLYFTYFGPEADAAVMNIAKFDAMTLGNHEFDEGDATLAGFVKKLQGTTILSANLKPAVASALNALEGEDKIQKYFIKTLKSGQKLGICGITIKSTTELSSFPDPGTTLDDEMKTATSCVQELKELGVNKIGLLTHVGYDNDIKWFTKIPGVSFVIGGHSHSLLGNKKFDKFNFPSRATYATLVNNVCVVTAWEYVKVVGAMTLEFDTKGNLVSCKGDVKIPLNSDKFEVRDANPRFNLPASDAEKTVSYLVNEGPFIPAIEDPSVVTALKPFVDQLQARSNQVIATTSEPICHTYGEVDPVCPGKEIRSRLGGGVCNLVSQGFLFNVPTADVAIQNRGGCRTDIQSGQFTFGNAFQILPFTNVLVTLVMTGDQIRRVIEDSMEFFLGPTGGGGGSYAFAAGLRFEVNYNATFGNRITKLEVNKRLKETWRPIGLTETYTVVTNDFIATPRDGYFTFSEIDKSDPTKFLNTFILYAQSFIDFVKDRGTLKDPPLSEYSTQKITFANGTSYSVQDSPV